MMHLLKLICSPVSNIFNSALYTFHYVSIKTHLRFQLLHNNCNLHSTMYLLKQKGWILKQYRIYYLHSTMYLLKQEYGLPTLESYKFTFHHVSIKTVRYLCNEKNPSKFTFHHVSIKTWKASG